MVCGIFHVLKTPSSSSSSNPQIDVGQVEGAFVQGAGMFTTEDLIWGDGEHKWLPKGCLATRGPGFYKIPAPNDVPLDFNVHLLKVCLLSAVHHFHRML